MGTCKNCDSPVTGKYCSACGHPVTLERVSGRYIVAEIGSVLNFQKGILFTIRELLIRPRKNIRAFIQEDRNRLVKPIMFIIITSLVYTFLVQIFHFEDGYIGFEGAKDSVTVLMFEWIQANYGYSNMLMAVFIGGWLQLFFRKHQFNFFEILILLCFVMGMGMLMYSVFIVVQAVTKVNLMQVAGVVSAIYITFAMGQFFDHKKVWSYVKAFLSYLLGMITFSLAVVILGTVIDRFI